MDSGYFIGLMDKKDDNHEDAIEIENYLNYADESTVVNTTVLVETLNRSVGKKDNIKQRKDLFTKYVTEEKDLDKFFEETDKLYQKYLRDNIQNITKDLNTKLKGTSVNVYHVKKGK